MSEMTTSPAVAPDHPLRSERVRDMAGLAARLLLGGVVLVAGAVKILHPAQSVLAVRGYQILPYDVAVAVGHALPLLEMVVGVLLVLGFFTRPAAALGGLLMLAFITGISAAWARGISIDCGCFGGGGTIAAAQTQYPQEIARDAGLLLCAAWLLVRPRTACSLDRRLF